MRSIGVLTDSTAYLPETLLRQYDIHVVPLLVHWDGETFRDGVDIHPQEFYERLKRSKTIPTTSQPSIQDFLHAYEQMAERYDGIVATLISSGISGTVASAQAAAQEFDKVPVVVVDTKTTSAAQGWATLAAARAAEAGGSLEEVRAAAQYVVDRLHTFFVVDTLKYLHKGGRIGGAARYLGTALNIKPILYFDKEGKIDALERVRTKKRALRRILELAQERAGDRPVNVGVIYAHTRDEGLALKAEAERVLNCREVLFVELSPVLGTHVGPGTLGLGFYPVEDEA